VERAYNNGNQNKITKQITGATLRQLVPMLGSNMAINVPFVLRATRAEWTGEKLF
jgi:hypothetical protein